MNPADKMRFVTIKKRSLPYRFAQTCQDRFAAGATYVSRDELVRAHYDPLLLNPVKLAYVMTRTRRLMDSVTPVNGFDPRIKVVNEDEARKFLARFKPATGFVRYMPHQVHSNNWIWMASCRWPLHVLISWAEREIAFNKEMSDGSSLQIMTGLAEQSQHWRETIAECTKRMANLDRIAAEWRAA